jgi:hypothetical protein
VEVPDVLHEQKTAHKTVAIKTLYFFIAPSGG